MADSAAAVADGYYCGVADQSVEDPVSPEAGGDEDVVAEVSAGSDCSGGAG